MTITAPGKLLLFGEHSVVYGYPSLVTAVDQRLSVTIEKSDNPGIHVDAPQVKDTRFVDAAISAVSDAYNLHLDGIVLKTASPFSGIYGFGSSSAVTVATLQALLIYGKVSVSKRELFDLAFKIVLQVQGVGSGFDVAAAIYGGTILYGKGGNPLEEIAFDTTEVSLVVGYSGVKSNTVDIVREVAKKRSEYPERVERIFEAITQLVSQAHKAIGEKDWQVVGKLMNFNQEYLRDLGVSTEKLEALVAAAKNAGAFGAKLSGAGGGDCMIALVPKHAISAVEAAITHAGGEVVPVRVHAEGVRIETTDDQEEHFVVVDREDNELGYRTRSDCHHNKTLIHRSVGLLIFDDQHRVLLQKRSLTKDTFPGFWSNSVGGHVSRGENYDQAIVRELKEELGVVLPVVFHDKFLVEEPQESEMSAFFTAIHNGPFHPDVREVETVAFFTKSELQEQIKNNQLQLTPLAQTLLQKAEFLP